MSEHIVGLMFCKNEGDILAQVIEAALPKVDSLMIADDGSTDNSWDIIQLFAEARKDKIEHIRQLPDPKDKGQRQALLDKIKKRYKPENTWVQIIESDVILLDTDVREAIKNRAVHDMAVTWAMINACRYPGASWKEVDTYPQWQIPLNQLMPQAHFLEHLLYTFRPLPKISYGDFRWRPYPRGFTHYKTGPIKAGPVKAAMSWDNTPLLLHVGYRGPTHYYEKFKNSGMGRFHSRYPTWDLSSPESVLATVGFFNDTWNKNAFPASRQGWINRKNPNAS